VIPNSTRLNPLTISTIKIGIKVIAAQASTKTQRGSQFAFHTGNDPILSRCLTQNGIAQADSISDLSISYTEITKLQGMALTLGDKGSLAEQWPICRSIAREVALLHYRELLSRTQRGDRPKDQAQIVVIKNSFFLPCKGGEPATIEHNLWLPSYISDDGSVSRNESKLKEICNSAFSGVQHHAYWITTAIVEDLTAQQNLQVHQMEKICLIAEKPHRGGEGILPILCPCPIRLAHLQNRSNEVTSLQSIRETSGTDVAYKIDLWRQAKGMNLLKSYAELGNPGLELSPMFELINFLNVLKNPPSVNKPR
jgi:hypothetical protein